jgi:dUTPase
VNQAAGWRRSARVGLCALLAISVLAVAAPPAGVASAAPNPIVAENQQPGSIGWIWGSQISDGATRQIKGFASATSVRQGESISFYVTTNPPQPYTLDIYRLGWYGGLGGRQRLHVALDGFVQDECVPDPTTGLAMCWWAESYRVTVPSDWTSGVYLGKLQNEDGFQNYIVFVVRDGRPAPFLYQQAITTDQAYNNFPDDGRTGKSLYTFNSFGPNTVSGDARAVKVSFDRPYAGYGFRDFDQFNAIRWLEKSGYDMTYSTDLDTHLNGGELRNHRAFLSVGHDEYWSKEMFDAAQSARDAGVNLAFFAANTAYWQVRFEQSDADVPNRVMVCYKNAAIDPITGPTTTVNFRDPPVNRPEQTLIGVQYTADVTTPNVPFVVTNSSHWAYAGTGLRDGDSIPSLVGYEMDRSHPNYPLPPGSNRTLLSDSPFTTKTGATDHANSSIYRAPSGAWVFASGTISWVWGLDDMIHGQADARVQRVTANVLDAFLGAAPPPTVDHLRATAPAAVTAGQPFVVDVRAEDSAGALFPQYSGTVHFASSDASAGVVLPPDSTLTNGQRSFSVTLATTGSQTVTVSDAANSLTTSVTVNVGAAPVGRFVLATSATPRSGTPFAFTVTAQNASGATDTGYTGTIRFTSTDTSTGVALPPNSTLTNGVGTFSATLMTSGAQAITATDTVTAAVTGTLAVNVGGAGASRLVVTTTASPTPGVAFNLTVTAQDPSGATDTSYAGTVHFTSSDASTGVVLPADSALTNGQKTFSATLATAGAQTITATDTATASINGTLAVNVGAASASRLVVTTAASPIAGASFSITVVAQDQFGNTDTTYAGTVHFTSSDTSASVVMPADSTLTNGQKSFSATLVTAGARTITATDKATATITGSLATTVSAAPATRLAVTTSATPTAGVSFSFTVTAQDQFANTDTGYAGMVRFTSTDASAGVVLPADSTLASGQGTFSATLATAGAQTIRGTDTVTATITGTRAVTVRPGAAAAITVETPAAVSAGQSFQMRVTVKDQFGNVATGYTGTVHFTSTDRNLLVNLPPDHKFTAAEAGTRTFNASLWTLGNQTITVTDTVNAGLKGTSPPINVGL